MSELSIEGHWWLPSNPGKKISGKLIKPDKDLGFLKLNGSFHLPGQEGKKEDVIFGLSQDGVIYTLSDCLSISDSFSASSHGGYFISSYSISSIVKGIHSENPSEILFESIKFVLSNTNQWFGLVPCKPKFDFEKDGKFSGTGLIKIKVPGTIDLILPSFNLKIVQISNFKTDLISGINFSWEWSFSAIPEKPIIFEKYLEEILIPIKNYFSLAIGIEISILDIIGIYDSQEVSLNNNIQRLENEEKMIHPKNILFSYKDIEDEFEHSLNMWLTQNKSKFALTHLYHQIIATSKNYSIDSFLTLMQAIEYYHRTTFLGKYIEKEEDFDKIKKHFLKNIPSELDRSFKESLKSKIKYFNEYSQRIRFRELVECLNTEFDNIVSNSIPNITDLINKIVDTRNYFTHHDDSLLSEILKDKDLIYAIIVLKYILELSLLRDIGISSKKLNLLLTRTEKYSIVKNFYKINP